MQSQHVMVQSLTHLTIDYFIYFLFSLLVPPGSSYNPIELPPKDHHA